MNLLLVANYEPDEGYAWDTIETVLRELGEKLIADGHNIFFSYSRITSEPSRVMRGAPFHFLSFNYQHVNKPGGALAFFKLLREHHIDAVYLTDRPTWAWQYALYRTAGVKRILVHDRTSGERRAGGPLRRLVKRLLHSTTLISADCAIGISDFVRRRLIEVNGLPSRRVHLVYNGIDLTRFAKKPTITLHDVLGLDARTQVIYCSGRANEYKGFHVLIEAAALLREMGVTGVVFAYCGGGPYFDELRERVRAYALPNFYFLGKRSDAAMLGSSAAITVVPALWAEAFGLTVVESMAAGVPVVASRTGGIPELLDHDSGILVTPGASSELARAILTLLEQPHLRAAMGTNGRALALQKFSLRQCASNLYRVVGPVLGHTQAARRSPQTLRPHTAVHN